MIDLANKKKRENWIKILKYKTSNFTSVRGNRERKKPRLSSLVFTKYDIRSYRPFEKVDEKREILILRMTTFAFGKQSHQKQTRKVNKPNDDMRFLPLSIYNRDL